MRSVSNSSERLVNSIDFSNERILITGAGGWFGRTAISLVSNMNTPTMLVTNKPRDIFIDAMKYTLDSWQPAVLEQFKPTIVIDCAYLTREYTLQMKQVKYIEENRLMHERAKWLFSQSSVQSYIGFSSGAVLAQEIQNLESPYEMLKDEFEREMGHLNFQLGKSLQIARVWSVSGALVTKVDGFAFSNMIKQSFGGKIQINSFNEVWRRYSLVDELIACMLVDNSPGTNLFDTGGSLIEIEELARIMAKKVSPEASIARSRVADKGIDHYYSDNSDWMKLCEKLNFEPSDLESQVELVSKYLRKGFN
jgi:nucleoside-diphosphate-sugar epimerase